MGGWTKDTIPITYFFYLDGGRFFSFLLGMDGWILRCVAHRILKPLGICFVRLWWFEV
jgi:hypothetical protein